MLLYLPYTQYKIWYSIEEVGIFSFDKIKIDLKQLSEGFRFILITDWFSQKLLRSSYLIKNMFNTLFQLYQHYR